MIRFVPVLNFSEKMLAKPKNMWPSIESEMMSIIFWESRGISQRFFFSFGCCWEKKMFEKVLLIYVCVDINSMHSDRYSQGENQKERARKTLASKPNVMYFCASFYVRAARSALFVGFVYLTLFYQRMQINSMKSMYENEAHIQS